MTVIDILIRLKEESYHLHHDGRISSIDFGQYNSAINLLTIFVYKFNLDKDTRFGSI